MKSLVVLMLCFVNLIFAQPPIGQPNDLHVCDDNNDGFASFDLTQNTPVVLGNLNPSLYNVSYYETSFDAEFGTNAITNPSSFTNIANPQTIFVRVEEIADTSNFAVANFSLVVNQIPIVITPIDLIEYDNPYDGFATFDLTQNEALMSNGTTGFSFYYYTSLANAQSGILPILSESSYFSNSQTIYVRVVNNTTGCFSIVDFDLIVQNPNNVYIPDLNFKNKLLSANANTSIAFSNGNMVKIDLNDDFEIQYSEVAVIDSLNVSFSNIINMTGIEAFTNLKKLDCSQNQIITLNVSNNLLLKKIYCYNNQLNNLNFQGLTNLNLLSCSSNQLTSLDVSSLINLNTLACSSNLLTNLTLGNLSNLDTVFCDNNPFSIVNFNGNQNIDYISITDCLNLESILLKNGIIEGTLLINNCPNLSLICADENQVLSLMGIVQSNGYSNCSVNTYCTFPPGGNYSNITGTSRVDYNNNGCDVQDTIFPYLELEVSLNGVSTNQSVYTNQVGQYDVYAQQNGLYTFTPNIENPTYYNVNPNPANITVTSIDGSTTVQDFCVTANGIHNDLEVVIVPVNAAMPGFNATYKILYKNKGNQIMSQNYGVNFFYNNNLMSFVSSNQAPDQQIAGALSWNYSNLMPQEVRTIYVTFTINTPTNPNYPVNINDVLTLTATILPQAGDETTQDNLFQFNQVVVGSYDPNDITCIEGEVVSPTLIGSYLHYLVRFENIGTAPTSFIVVNLNVNPNDYDVETFRILEASHNAKIRRNGNSIDIYFENCQLDSGGHGNILFKMKSKNSLQASDDVMSNAKIYFDYNFPIETNDATTIFQTLSNQDFVKDETVKIYPNPAKDFFNVVSEHELKAITIYDAQGRIVQVIKATSYEKTVDITKLSKGIYVLEISSEQGKSIEKLVVE